MAEFIENGKNGILIQNDDAVELRNAMEKMFIESRKFVKFVKANKDYYLNKYSWDSVASRIGHVISIID
jgi:glycosyltransferase involved in cell wall biosynthesis